MEKKETQTILFENQFQVTEDFMKKYGKELGKIWKSREVFLYSTMVFCFVNSILCIDIFSKSNRKEVFYLISSFQFLLFLILLGFISSIITTSRRLKKRLKEEELTNYNNLLERHYIFRQETLEFSNGIRFDYSQIRKIRVSENFVVLEFRYPLPLGLAAIIKKDAFSIGTVDFFLDFIASRKNKK